MVTSVSDPCKQAPCYKPSFLICSSTQNCLVTELTKTASIWMHALRHSHRSAICCVWFEQVSHIHMHKDQFFRHTAIFTQKWKAIKESKSHQYSSRHHTDAVHLRSSLYFILAPLGFLFIGSTCRPAHLQCICVCEQTLEPTGCEGAAAL